MILGIILLVGFMFSILDVIIAYVMGLIVKKDEIAAIYEKANN